ncbi:MAG: dihydrolipoyl dehydrogenase [Candidatus Hinthialibacter antarcticus]|nr:dihydrolipoyl dehydrogenase [Candidatus Hinthialibacter antarcticus]
MKPIQTEIVVVGGGPGGYAAAFYAADRGKKVIMIEKYKRLGGVCMNRGCIPSKAYLHAAKLIEEAKESSFRGVTFAEPKIDLDKLRAWKESILDKLAKGVESLAARRNVQVMYGRGLFEDSNTLRVETDEGQKYVKFEQAIVAVGSVPALPSAFDLGNPRVMTSDEALELQDIPKDMLIVGGGYIGMEMGTVYKTLGSNIVVVEAVDTILAGADRDLIRYVKERADKEFKEVRLNAKVTNMATSGKKIKVTMSIDGGKPVEEKYDRVLVSVGRAPNSEDIGLENTSATTDRKGFIEVSKTMQTKDPSIYAIGDVVGGAMLAHKASREARIAVDVILGDENAFENVIVPAVVFTDPELAWCGLTESEAKERGIEVQIAKFPWSASGRALTFDRPDGMTKLIVEPETDRVLGVGIAGVGAGDLISEGAFAIEMGATVRDLAEVVHPHPTLSETIMECAENFYGYSTHTYSATKKD